MTEEYEVQRSPAWFNWRRAHLGASDAAAILGLSPWKTALDLYNEKVNPQETLTSSNFAMRRGVELEPLALAKFEAETGYLMTPRVLTHPKYEFLSASLDGLELDGSCACEIKCPGRADHELALKGIVPEKYMPQLQHIMEVCQLPEIYYMSYISDSDFTIFKVSKDNDYTARLLQAELDFWQRVQDRNPPIPTDRDTFEITTPEWTHYRDQYAAIYTEKKDLQDKLTRIKSIEDEIRKELIYLADNKSAEGAGIKLTKCVPRKCYDYEKMIEDKLGKDFDKTPYLKPSTESWRISFKGDKDD
jgi:putative phage-type endonuclease